MVNSEDKYKSLMLVKSLEGLTSEDALLHIGNLTDVSFDLRKTEGLLHSIQLSEELQNRELNDEQLALSHYFMANANADIRRISRGETDKSWEWEQDEIEKEIFHLRTALQTGHESLPDERICQILTNLGNLMNEIGRFVEAVQYWDKALERLPSFPMACGNKGFGLAHYACSLYDEGHAIVFMKNAHADLVKALSFTLPGSAKKSFAEHKKWIETIIPEEELENEFDMNSFSLGDTDEEIQYRKWCLKNCLFLNPLNDLGLYPIGGRDILTTPDIVMDIGEGPYYPGYFNQMKQEYVSARYFYYEGMKADEPHFSDKEVLLFNTLDYPSYSIAAERMKTAFRMAYSLFDKIAFFLNHYLHLSIPEKKVSF